MVHHLKRLSSLFVCCMLISSPMWGAIHPRDGQVSTFAIPPSGYVAIDSLEQIARSKPTDHFFTQFKIFYLPVLRRLHQNTKKSPFPLSETEQRAVKEAYALLGHWAYRMYATASGGNTPESMQVVIDQAQAFIRAGSLETLRPIWIRVWQIGDYSDALSNDLIVPMRAYQIDVVAASRIIPLGAGLLTGIEHDEQDRYLDKHHPFIQLLYAYWHPPKEYEKYNPLMLAMNWSNVLKAMVGNSLGGASKGPKPSVHEGEQPGAAGVEHDQELAFKEVAQGPYFFILLLSEGEWAMAWHTLLISGGEMNDWARRNRKWVDLPVIIAWAIYGSLFGMELLSKKKLGEGLALSGLLIDLVSIEPEAVYGFIYASAVPFLLLNNREFYREDLQIRGRVLWQQPTFSPKHYTQLTQWMEKAALPFLILSYFYDQPQHVVQWGNKIGGALHQLPPAGAFALTWTGNKILTLYRGSRMHIYLRKNAGSHYNFLQYGVYIAPQVVLFASVLENEFQVLLSDSFPGVFPGPPMDLDSSNQARISPLASGALLLYGMLGRYLYTHTKLSPDEDEISPMRTTMFFLGVLPVFVLGGGLLENHVNDWVNPLGDEKNTLVSQEGMLLRNDTLSSQPEGQDLSPPSAGYGTRFLSPRIAFPTTAFVLYGQYLTHMLYAPDFQRDMKAHIVKIGGLMALTLLSIMDIFPLLPQVGLPLTAGYFGIQSLYSYFSSRFSQR